MEASSDVFAYNRWANRLLLEAAAELSPSELDRACGGVSPIVLGGFAVIFLLPSFVAWCLAVAPFGISTRGQRARASGA